MANEKKEKISNHRVTTNYNQIQKMIIEQSGDGSGLICFEVKNLKSILFEGKMPKARKFTPSSETLPVQKNFVIECKKGSLKLDLEQLLKKLDQNLCDAILRGGRNPTSKVTIESITLPILQDPFLIHSFILALQKIISKFEEKNIETLIKYYIPMLEKCSKSQVIISFSCLVCPVHRSASLCDP